MGEIVTHILQKFFFLPLKLLVHFAQPHDIFLMNAKYNPLMPKMERVGIGRHEGKTKFCVTIQSDKVS